MFPELFFEYCLHFKSPPQNKTSLTISSYYSLCKMAFCRYTYIVFFLFESFLTSNNCNVIIVLFSLPPTVSYFQFCLRDTHIQKTSSSRLLRHEKQIMADFVLLARVHGKTPRILCQYPPARKVWKSK